jgi:starch phosphorylase
MRKDCSLCRDSSAYLAKLRQNWDALRIEEITSSSERILSIGDTISVKAKIFLANLTPEELGVELYFGPLSSQGEIERPRRLEMSPCGAEGKAAMYCAQVTCDRTGRQGFTVRILPKHPSLVHPFIPGMVKWG